MVASTGINEQLLEASCELKRQMWTPGYVFSAAHQKKGTVSSWCTSVLVAS